MNTLLLQPLTAERFAPYGAVIDFASACRRFPINAGSALRHHALARVEASAGAAVISLLRATAFALPLTVRMLERHPLGTQAFIPLSPLRYVVVVATDVAAPVAFLAEPGQGIQYHRGAWHHPLLPLADGDFLIVDRDGDGHNCEEITLPQPWQILG
ncbi:MAG: ureidoglycolate lyase [Lysobacterales bacterium]